MLRLFVILVSVFAFSKVAFATGATSADVNKKTTTEMTTDATADKEEDGTKDEVNDKMVKKIDDKAEGNKTK